MKVEAVARLPMNSELIALFSKSADPFAARALRSPMSYLTIL